MYYINNLIIKRIKMTNLVYVLQLDNPIRLYFNPTDIRTLTFSSEFFQVHSQASEIRSSGLGATSTAV